MLLAVAIALCILWTLRFIWREESLGAVVSTRVGTWRDSEDTEFPPGTTRLARPSSAPLRSHRERSPAPSRLLLLGPGSSSPSLRGRTEP